MLVSTLLVDLLGYWANQLSTLAIRLNPGIRKAFQTVCPILQLHRHEIAFPDVKAFWKSMKLYSTAMPCRSNTEAKLFDCWTVRVTSCPSLDPDRLSLLNINKVGLYRRCFTARQYSVLHDIEQLPACVRRRLKARRKLQTVWRPPLPTQ